MNIKSILRLAVVCCTVSLIPTGLSAAEKRGKGEPNAATRATPSEKIDINTANVAALQTLPGVGPDTAAAIVAGRPFKNVSDLERVKGIGPEKLKDLRPLVSASKDREAVVTHGESTSAAKKATPASRSKTAERDVVEAERDRARTTPMRDVPPIAGGGNQPTTNSPRAREHSEAPATVGAERPRDAQGRFASRTDAAARVNLNTATKAELEALPDIGPVKAQAIIEARPFSTPQDIMRVKGIKEGTYEAIKDRITIR